MMTNNLPGVDMTACIRDVPPLVSLYVSSEKSEWVAGKPGVWVKNLYEDPSTGERTLLIKADPGMRSPSHSHEEFEQVFILSGSFFDDERVMRAGDYCCRAPGAMHSGGSDEGAVMLVVYTPNG